MLKWDILIPQFGNDLFYLVYLYIIIVRIIYFFYFNFTNSNFYNAATYNVISLFYKIYNN